MKKRVCKGALLLCGILFFACRGTNDPTPFFSPELDGPVVTGLIITGEDSPEPLASWGKPSEPRDPNGRLAISTPYPNPNNGSAFVQFQLNESMRIDMWVVMAYHPAMQPTREIFAANGTIYKTNSLSVRTLIKNNLRARGIYSISWDGRDDSGNVVPDGFYRIYIKGGNTNTLLWTDLLLLREPCKAPPLLRTLLSNINFKGC
ncbi:hypothetical protein L0337_33870 [candidate division KSB1 bacterium]|nr:hypothetical protein [candidate division KSB1 bacterium]